MKLVIYRLSHVAWALSFVLNLLQFGWPSSKIFLLVCVALILKLLYINKTIQDQIWLIRDL